MSANFSSTMETKNDLVTLTSAAITANINKNPSRNFKLVKTKSNDDEILHKFSFYIIFSIFRFSSFVCLLCFHFSLLFAYKTRHNYSSFLGFLSTRNRIMRVLSCTRKREKNIIIII